MNRSLMLAVGLLVCSEASHATAENNALTMTAQLVSPISSRNNKKGDKVSAVILSPPSYRGAPLEGEIDDAKSSGNLQKTSSLRFAFKRLAYGGQIVPVHVDVVGFQNSKGQVGVDEEGRVVKKSNGIGKAVAAAGIGATLGALLNGGKGAAIGAGIGLAASFLLVSVAVKGPDIAFDANSVFELAVRPCENCAGDQPALAQRQFSNGVFSLFYPSDWRAYWDGRSDEMKAAPDSGVVWANGANIEIGYGIVAGLYDPQRGNQSLQNATYELIRALKARSPDLELLPPNESSSSGEWLIVPMLRQSPLETGREVQLVITTASRYGVFYLIAVAPTSRSQQITDVARAILQTLRFRD